MKNLNEMYNKAAEICLNEGIEIDDTPTGAISAWVDNNVSFRPETKFFIVFGIACAMADIKAKRQGYKNETDRAFQAAFKKHPNAFDSMKY